MDLWNNAVGRKYGKQVKTRKDLLDKLNKALENKELIITPEDPRKYKDTSSYDVDSKKPVVVVKESETGRNELFLDMLVCGLRTAYENEQ